MSSTSARYLKVRDLAKGGMARVELACRVEGTFKRLVAIKRLLSHLEDDEESRSMFLNEARLAAMVRHPNVVSVIDVGEDEDGPYTVMEFVAGIDLGELIRKTSSQDQSVPMQVALSIGRDIARGLSAAHCASDHRGDPIEIIHRDLSPQNVMVSFTGEAMLVDFGIAKAAGTGPKTTTGHLKGKVAYMSPEQLRFEPLTPRSDLFALGVVLYELLSGARLYRSADAYSSASRVMHDPPPDLGEARADAPDELVELMFELLAKEAETRPPTASEVAERLDRVLAQVVATHDTYRVADFVDLVAEEVRRERERMVRDSLDAAMGQFDAEPAQSPRFDPEDVTRDAPAPTVNKPRRRGVFGAAMLGVTVLVGAGVALGLQGGDGTPAEAAVEPVEAPAQATPNPTEDGSETTAEPGEADTTPTDRTEPSPLAEATDARAPDPQTATRAAGARSADPPAETSRPPRAGRRRRRVRATEAARAEPDSDPASPYVTWTGE